jgi:hypothetical protein
MTWSDLARRGLPACDAVVNLAGQHILDLRRRWTAAYRDEVVNSRVETTKQVVKALNESASPPEVFISAAGKCFYGTRALGAAEAYPELDEDSDPMGLDFPAELVQLWEAAADDVDSTRLRHVKLRIGIVLAGLEQPSGRGGGPWCGPHRNGSCAYWWAASARRSFFRASSCDRGGRLKPVMCFATHVSSRRWPTW